MVEIILRIDRIGGKYMVDSETIDMVLRIDERKLDKTQSLIDHPKTNPPLKTADRRAKLKRFGYTDSDCDAMKAAGVDV